MPALSAGHSPAKPRREGGEASERGAGEEGLKMESW